MKKTKNLLFTFLVMGLIVTPGLKVNALEGVEEPVEENVGNVVTPAPEAPAIPQAETTPVGAPIAPQDDDTPVLQADDDENVAPQAADSAPEAPAPAPRVGSVVVKDASGNRLITVPSSVLADSLSVGYKITKVTLAPLDENGDDMEGAKRVDLVDGRNTIEYTIDGKTFTITITKQSLIDGLTSDVHTAVDAKYPGYYVYKDVEKNAIVVANYIRLDDNDKDVLKTDIYYTYDFNVDTYKTVDEVMAALAEALKTTAPEAEVDANSGVLTDTAAKKLKETAKVVKATVGAAEWTIDASKLTNGFDLRVDIDNSVRKQTKDAIEKLLAQTDVRRIMDFYHTGSLPAGTKVKIYAGDKFNANETLTLYYYNPTTNKLQAVNKDLKVDEKGFVEFTLDHCSAYVLLPSVNNAKNVQLLATKYNPQTGTMNVTLYAGIALASLAGIVVLRKQMN